jgi:ribosomal protein S17E
MYQQGYQPGRDQTEDADRSAEELRQDIAARRELITETVDRISDRFQRTFDWRAYVADYPLVALGAAAGAGFLLSGLFKHRLTPAERIKEALADSVEEMTDRFRDQFDGAFNTKPALSRSIKAAATGAIVNAVTGYLKNRLSGASDYRERYSDAGFDEFDYENLSQARRPGEWRRE